MMNCPYHPNEEMLIHYRGFYCDECNSTPAFYHKNINLSAYSAIHTYLKVGSVSSNHTLETCDFAFVQIKNTSYFKMILNKKGPITYDHIFLMGPDGDIIYKRKSGPSPEKNYIFWKQVQ